MHAHAASHVPSDTTGENDIPTPVLVRPRGRVPTYQPRVKMAFANTHLIFGVRLEPHEHEQMTTKAAWELPHNKNTDSVKPAEIRAPTLKPGVPV